MAFASNRNETGAEGTGRRSPDKGGWTGTTVGINAMFFDPQHGTISPELLQSATWYQSLSDAHQLLVLKSSRLTHHAPGDHVARQGERSDEWLGVESGLLKVCGAQADGRSVMYTGIPAGGWVGEGSVIKGERRRYNVLALRKSIVLRVPSATFTTLMRESNMFAGFVISHLNERLGQYIGMVEAARMKDPEVRIARGLVGLFNPMLFPKLQTHVDFSQSEIGELIGLSRQRVNEGIHKLAKRRLLISEYGRIRIGQLKMLQDFAYS